MKRLTAAALVFCALPAFASDRVPPVASAVVKKECGACHMAFQPVFLPQRSWLALLGGLADHFGEPAKIAEEDRREIVGYMTGGAADVAFSKEGVKMLRGVKETETPLRITSLPSWRRKHAEETGPEGEGHHEDDDGGDGENRKNAKPGSIRKSDCLACHPMAEGGYYDDD